MQNKPLDKSSYPILSQIGRLSSGKECLIANIRRKLEIKLVTKKIGKFIVTSALVGAVAVTGATSAVYAYEGEKSVTLTKSDMWVNTSAINAKEIAYSGSVNRNSNKSVWFISEYKNDTGWHYDTKILVGAGVNCPTMNSSIYTTKIKLRLQLNPYGTQTTGGSASGKAWPVKQ